MASQRITIDPSASPLAANLLATVNQLAEARRRLRDAAAYAEQSASGADFAAFNAAFGVTLPGGAAADTLYNLLVGSASDLNAPGNIDNLIERTGTA